MLEGSTESDQFQGSWGYFHLFTSGLNELQCKVECFIFSVVFFIYKDPVS